MSLWRGPRRPTRRLVAIDTRPRRPCRPAVESLEERRLFSVGYVPVNLASDVPGLARVTDPHLVNPWGISFSPTGPFWFSDNRAGVSDLLDGRGRPIPVVVRVPAADRSLGAPTGTVFNGGPGFVVARNGARAPSRFLFAGEDGTISGWSNAVDPTHAIVAVDNSAAGAVYKGLALATDDTGRPLLYAANFAAGRVDVFDGDFRPVTGPGAFRDPDLPAGYAPFNVQPIGRLLFVTYAQRDGAGEDDARGAGHGFIDVYDTAGELVRRFASAGALDSPWGLAAAPADFGPAGGALLVGNTGDGRINAYDLATGAFLGPLADGLGVAITIPNLWAVTFGNGHLGGASDTLFFTAGPDDEEHGLFGAIQAPRRRGADTAGPGAFDPDAPGEVDDYPLPPRTGPAVHDPGPALPTGVLMPLNESSLILVPALSAVPEPPARGGVTAAPASAGIALQSFAESPASMPRPIPPGTGDPAFPMAIRSASPQVGAILDVSPREVAPGRAAPRPPDATSVEVETRDTSVGSGAPGGGRAPVQGASTGEDMPSGLGSGSEASAAEDRADDPWAPLPTGAQAVSAGEPSAEHHGAEAGGSQVGPVLNGLLVAVAVPVVIYGMRKTRPNDRTRSC